MKNLDIKKKLDIDWRFLTAGAAAAGVLGICLTVQGCDIQKAIKFDIPSDVQGVIGSKEREPLANAEYVWKQWTSYVETNSAKLSQNIEGAQGQVAMIENLTSMGLSTLEGVSGQFPGGALAFSGLSLMAGWFLKRPGENKAVEKEKEKSYNAGLEKAKDLLMKNIKG